MKILKSTLIMVLLLTISQWAVAQSFTVPKDYKLKKKSDYAKYEQDFIGAVNWLEQVPVGEQTHKRSKVDRFVIEWISGSPDISVVIKENIVVFTDKNPNLLVNFLGGWGKYALEHPEDKDDEVKCNVAGIRSAIKVYQLGGEIKKDKKMEKLIKLDKNGKLEEWVREQLKK